MTSLMRWEPFGDIRSLRERMDRLFEDFFRGPRIVPWESSDLVFPVDLYETEDSLVVKASLPGVKPEEVNISISGDVLTIKGETKSEEEVKQENYHRREMRYGSFCRSIPLPTRVEQDKAEATFEHGILTVTLPKAEEVKPKSIQIKARPVVEGKKS
ncbi:MAG: Hsp20/alpha crystallin family protein [Dehalococcoidia bacterium]